MPISFARTIATLVLWTTSFGPVLAQVTPPTSPAPTDTTRKYENPAGVSGQAKQPWYKSKLVKATAVPALLITYGAIHANNGGFYTNEQANRDIHKLFPGYRTRLDDLLILAPYAELGLVALAGVESRSDRLNLLLVVLKSEAIMLTSTFAVKHLVQSERPDKSDKLSFPSGHTAQAFLAASIVHTEFRDQSQWYGVGAYAIATSVAALRMMNTKHWQSDVIAGAGFGILSAHLGYLTHRNRWGRQPRLPKGMGFSPTWQTGYTPTGSLAGAPGLRFTWQLQ
ncbi:phosphatase PAP2 family protein [Hymenobacter sp. BT635]|uniref:Phosphatase PAP2 family protein n=1 Tax=Hymenobacter nitidus TaxID=2880929 RepID=A0ABS8ALH7_9BACT|nr:phosphatase PAP2 family protein [Hymenobacter nitidus]MCB2379839.1 phosphatase PAP2 family protein [Hymenobacter nitidus]